MNTIEELEAKERSLWAQVGELEKPFKEKQAEWNDVYTALQKARAKESIRIEVQAEMKAKS